MRELQYFISEKNGIVVVSFIGPLIRENAGTFEECGRALAKVPARWVILSFRDVPPELDKTFLFPALARFQKQIRDKKIELKISALHPEMKKTLCEQGIIRMDELYNNLADALQTLSVSLKAAA